MVETFELALERIAQESADIQTLFSGDGVSIRGISRRRESANPVQYLKRLRNAAQFTKDVYTGKRPVYQFTEAMTTSDFPQLFGDILDRSLLSSYSAAPVTWDQYANRAVLTSFRDVKRFRIDGGEGTLPTVPEATGYKAASLVDDVYTYAPKKYGRRIPLSWEATVNDDMGAFRDIPNKFGVAARRTEERFATTRYAGATGPLGTVYSVGNANVITGNPALSLAALNTARTILSNMRDVDGEPIVIEQFILVVPPALEITAKNIVNATAVEWTTLGGTPDGSGGIRLTSGNWVGSTMKVVVNAYLPVISTTNGATSWYLFADPNNGRPALEIGFLTGHEQPMITMKAPNQVLVGGGGGQLMEDFDFDTVQYRVRHVFGGAILDPKMTVASNGTGS